MTRRLSLLWVVFGLSLLLPGSIWADKSQEESKHSLSNVKWEPFNTVLNRVAVAATSDDWRKASWSDQALQTTLATILGQVKSTINRDDITLPVTFGAVRPVSRDNKSPHLANQFLVTKRGHVATAQHCILLADESIHVSHAKDCLIIARGAVSVGHGRRNLIIAGHFIHVSHDGNPDPEDPAGVHGSVLISGAVVNVSHARNTICCAPLKADIAFANDVHFINSPNRVISHDRNSKSHTEQSGSLPAIAKRHPLANKLEVTRIVPPDDSGEGASVTIKKGQEDIVVRKGEAVVNAEGKPLPGLEGWNLVFVGEEFALFAKEGDYIGRHLPSGN